MNIGIGIAERFEFDDFRDDISVMTDCFELMTNGRALDDAAWMSDVCQAHNGKRIHLHSTALSVASAELDQDEVSYIANLCRSVEPVTVSDHLSFRTAGDVHLENFVPPLLGKSSQRLIKSNVERIQAAIGRKFDLENVTHLLGTQHDVLTERDFLMDLCNTVGCGMVLDVNNLYIDARNFAFDPLRYLDGVDLEHVSTIHVAGFTVDHDGQLVDTHMEKINDQVLSLLSATLERLPHGVDVILERDNGTGTRGEIVGELSRIRDVVQACGMSVDSRMG